MTRFRPVLFVATTVTIAACGSAERAALPTPPVPSAPAKKTVMRMDDTIRFSGLGQYRNVHLVATDTLGAPIAHPTFVWSLPFIVEDSATGIISTTLVARSPGGSIATAIGTGVLAGDTARAVVIVTQVPRVVSVLGPDSAQGLAVGETGRVFAILLDSNYRNIEFAKIDLTSVDPSVATIDATGLITARATGLGIVRASSSAGLTSDAKFQVVPRVELGASRVVLPLRPFETYYRPAATLGDDGSSCLLETLISRPGPGSTDNFSCYGPDGTLRFKRNDYGAYAAIDSAGTVYAANLKLAAIGRNGADLWELDYAPLIADQRGSLIGRPVIGPGAVYLSYLFRAFAVSPSGAVKWNRTFSDTVTSIVPAAGRVFITTSSGVVALDTSGAKLWELAAPFAQARVAGDGSLLVMSFGGTSYRATQEILIGVAPSGVERFRTVVGTEEIFVPQSLPWGLAPDGSVVVVLGRTLVSRDRGTGALRWSVPAPPGFNKAVFGTSDHRVLVYADYIFAYDASTGAFLGRTADRDSPDHGARLFPGALYLAGANGIRRYEVPFGPTP